MKTNLYKFRDFKNKIISLYNISRYDSDIISYADNFKKQYGDFFKVEKNISSDSKVILIYSCLNLSYCMHIESIIGKILEQLGHKIIILTSYSLKTLSDNIHWKIYGFKDILYFEDFVKTFLSKEAIRVIKDIEKVENIDNIKELKYRNTNIGLHSLASYSGNLPTKNLKDDKIFTREITKIIRKSCYNVEAVERIINLVKPTKILCVEKGDVGRCEIFYESIYRGIDYIQWCSCHEPDSIIMKRFHTNNYRAHPGSISSKSWSEILQDTNNYTDIVLDYFKSGYLDGKWFKYKNLTTDKMLIDKDELIKRLNLDKNKKNVIIFSHILNDANFFYGDDLFRGGFSEWLVRTVEVAGNNKEVNWLLKLHPANVYRRRYSGESGDYSEIVAIKNTLGEIPQNIKVIPPDIDINPYSFFQVADYGITVRGTIGAELPCFGIPVVTAGTGRYSGKGFTIDSVSVEEYLEKVRNIHKIEPLSQKERNLAIKHAYLFFKERPAKYDTCIKDNYPYPLGHPIYRDIEIINQDLLNNFQLLNIANFIAFSKDEDYLQSKRY